MGGSPEIGRGIEDFSAVENFRSTGATGYEDTAVRQKIRRMRRASGYEVGGILKSERIGPSKLGSETQATAE